MQSCKMSGYLHISTAKLRKCNDAVGTDQVYNDACRKLGNSHRIMNERSSEAAAWQMS